MRGPLITVWLQIRVLPGPLGRRRARPASYGWASHASLLAQLKYRKQLHAK
jgi:hypothetical protein